MQVSSHCCTSRILEYSILLHRAKVSKLTLEVDSSKGKNKLLNIMTVFRYVRHVLLVLHRIINIYHNNIFEVGLSIL